MDAPEAASAKLAPSSRIPTAKTVFMAVTLVPASWQERTAMETGGGHCYGRLDHSSIRLLWSPAVFACSAACMQQLRGVADVAGCTQPERRQRRVPYEEGSRGSAGGRQRHRRGGVRAAACTCTDLGVEHLLGSRSSALLAALARGPWLPWR